VRRTPWIALGAAATICLVWLAWRALRADDRALPPRIVTEDVVADLADTFDPSAVVREAADGPVRRGGVQPSPYLEGEGPYRRAIVAPPPSEVRFEVRTPAGAALRFGVGVQGAGRRDRAAAGVRFTVTVGGRRAFSRIVNPAATRRDRRWFDERVELPEGETTEIALATEVVGSGTHLAGTPGWSHVRVVHETVHERQPARLGAPSLLVLLVDALRRDHLGCYGATPSPSPTLDALAARGLVFEDAVSQSSWTLPSVASLLTGLLPPSHGVAGEAREARAEGEAAAGTDPSFLPDPLLTLAELAQAVGVSTIGVSASPIISRSTNMSQGFERFVELRRKGSGALWTRAADVNDAFLAWLRPNRRHRFVAYLHYMDVHHPYQPPPPFRPATPPGVTGAVAEGNVSVLAKALNAGGAPLSAPEVEHLGRLYDAGIAYWDAELARLLAALADLGVLDGTVIVVTADHGEAFQEHGRLAHGVTLYDELLRVPLVIAGPGVGRGRARRQAQGVDLLPTMARLLGLSTLPDVSGQDLLARRETRPAFAATRWGLLPDGRWDALVALRTASWKLIYAPGSGHTELFDLVHDPGERRNLAGRAPEEHAMTDLLRRVQDTAPPPPRVSGHDPTVRERLRALGYVD
jgi:arylsulfatase A-like enzyme